MAKIFTPSEPLYSVPSDWLGTLGQAKHIRHCDLIVVANVKGDVPALLTDRGVSQVAADRITSALRWSRQPIAWTTLKLAIDSGIVDPDHAGVYLWRAQPTGSPIVRIEPDGTPTVLGHFRHDPHLHGRGSYIEPTPPQETSAP